MKTLLLSTYRFPLAYYPPHYYSILVLRCCLLVGLSCPLTGPTKPCSPHGYSDGDSRHLLECNEFLTIWLCRLGSVFVVVRSVVVVVSTLLFPILGSWKLGKVYVVLDFIITNYTMYVYPPVTCSFHNISSGIFFWNLMRSAVRIHFVKNPDSTSGKWSFMY